MISFLRNWVHRLYRHHVPTTYSYPFVHGYPAQCRVCKRCGQGHIRYIHLVALGMVTWLPALEINDKHCNCHRANDNAWRKRDLWQSWNEYETKIARDDYGVIVRRIKRDPHFKPAKAK